MKAKSSLIILFLLFFITSCACPLATFTENPLSATANSEYAERLAEQFCPIIYLCGEDEVIENFEPEQIEIMLDTASLLNAEDPSFFEKATIYSLLQWTQSGYYLDLVGLDPTINSPDEYKRNYDKVKEQYQPTIYARVSEAGGESYTVVQYWIFYYFNDWRNCHEGDWELVQLCFPGYTTQELLEGAEEPIFAAYSQHQAGQKMLWRDMKANALVLETHPLVYVARGSHANYFTTGNFWAGLDFDNTGASSWKIIRPEQFNLVLLPEVGNEDASLGWLEFKGNWGEYLGFSFSILGLKFWQRGPFGPPWSEGGQRSGKWEHPNEWAAGLPEYPDPFWTYFFSLPGDWFNRAFFCLFSPADIHVYDSLGRHVGLNEKGELENQIPGAVYITPEGTQYKTIVIPNADISQEYSVVMTGTGSGSMDLKVQIPDAKKEIKYYLEYINVPVSPTTTARLKIVPDRVVNIELDSDGDGVFELKSTPGNFEEKKMIVSVLEANIDIEPRILDLTRVTGGEPITAYIELPEGYDPSDIDTGTLRLMEDIPPCEKPIELVDRNNDGIYELMVQFDRQLVIDYLKKKGLTSGRVRLSLTGAINGRQFEGIHTGITIMNEANGGDAPTGENTSVGKR